VCKEKAFVKKSHILRKASIILLITILIPAYAWAWELNYYTDFETSPVLADDSGLTWSMCEDPDCNGENKSCDAISLASSPAFGSSSMKAYHRCGDYACGGNRAMIQDSDAVGGNGVEFWEGFAVLIPSSEKLEDIGWMVIAQYHQNNTASGPLQPPIAVRSRGGTLNIVVRYCDDSTYVCADRVKGETNFDYGSWPRDQWVRIVLHIRFSPASARGIFEAWVNGAQVADMHNVKVGYNSATANYPTYGIYRESKDLCGGVYEHTLYIDEIRRKMGSGDFYDDVVPPGDIPNRKMPIPMKLKIDS
jgi:hypothetical protein